MSWRWPDMSRRSRALPFRGHGLGRELLLSAMDRLAELGFQSCFLQVASSNTPALRLYRESGFAEERAYSKWFEVTVKHG